VHCPEDHRDESDDAREGRVGPSQNEDRADEHDSVNGVRARHERRVEDHGHLGDDFVADEDRENEDRQVAQQHVDHGSLLAVPAPAAPAVPAAPGAAPAPAGCSIRSRVGAWRIFPSCVTQVSRMMSSLKSRFSFPSFTISRAKLVMFREYIWLAWIGIVAASRIGPMIVTSWRTISWPGSVNAQFPPMSAARSTITEPGFILATASAGMSFGAAKPGT